MQQLPRALISFAAYKHFLLHKNKIPINPHTLMTYPKGSNWQHDLSYTTDSITAIVLAKKMGGSYGIGYLFTDNDPFFFIDIDKCLETNNTWSPLAIKIMASLPGAAIEISQSGRGLHIFGQGTVPDHACKNTALGLEFYTKNRFVALTGTNAIGSASIDFSVQLPTLIDSYFKPKINVQDKLWTNVAVKESTPITNDDKLIQQALKSKTNFKDLWEKNIEALAASYLNNTDKKRNYDDSSADAALAQHLAFWTGNNCARMLILMQRSALVRDKWNREDYLRRTILYAIALQEKFYNYNANPFDNVTSPKIVESYQYLSATMQLEYFVNCVYIQDLHRVFIPTGALLKSEQFNATYGGYIFQLDATGDKTTRKAWDAFTESQVIRWPIANSLCFRPTLAAGEFINVEGLTLVNTYVPIKTRRIDGDPTPFLNHLQHVLPVEHDRNILLAYMSACIQHIGIKFQWAPLIQGTPGNGKTLFTRCVAYAVGNRYTHFPKTSDIDNKFNAWLMNKLFIGVEDIVVHNNKKEVLEALELMITSDRIEMQAKGTDQIVIDNYANFMINMNPRDGLRKTRKDRRFCVFYTAQQSADDIIRDGMSDNYFPNIYKWLRKDGYAIVNNYLTNYKIPVELNPAGNCQWAPITSTTEEAVSISMGAIEQEILEAVEEGRPGFAGGWISSKAVERLLASIRMERAIPRNRRRELLQSIGYDYHPALKDGRSNNVIIMDDGKPRLFIKNGHIHTNLLNGADVARCYQDAQTSSSLNIAQQMFGN